MTEHRPPAPACAATFTCKVCDKEASRDGVSHWCENCGITWEDPFKPGTWDDGPQCTHEITSTPPSEVGRRIRCILTAGHVGVHLVTGYNGFDLYEWGPRRCRQGCPGCAQETAEQVEAQRLRLQNEHQHAMNGYD